MNMLKSVGEKKRREEGVEKKEESVCQTSEAPHKYQVQFNKNFTLRQWMKLGGVYCKLPFFFVF